MAHEVRVTRPPGTASTQPIRWRQIGIILASVMLGGFIWLHAAGPGAHAGTDFGAYLTGAHDVVTGQNPYHDLLTTAPTTTSGDSGLHAHGYVYPPLLAIVLAVPLLLGFNTTFVWIMWAIINSAAVLWMGWELQHALVIFADRPADPITQRWQRWTAAVLFATASLLPAIVTYDLWLGQADLLMAALVVGACGLWLRRNPWAAAVLAVAIAIKPTMALILVVWLWKGDWRAALRGAVLAVAFVGASFVVVGFAALRDYLTFFVQWNAFQANAEYINQAPYGMLLRLFTVNPFTQPLIVLPWLVTPLRLVSIGGALWLWVRAVPRQRAVQPLIGMSELLLALPLIVLLSPLAEDIHFCIIVPTLVGLAWVAWQQRLTRLPATWVLWAALALSCVPRMQELIYPNRFVPLPGQSDPHLGPLMVLLRSGTLLFLAIAALAAGSVVLQTVKADTPAS